jgi:hypothetical protein
MAVTEASGLNLAEMFPPVLIVGVNDTDGLLYPCGIDVIDPKDKALAMKLLGGTLVPPNAPPKSLTLTWV